MPEYNNFKITNNSIIWHDFGLHTYLFLLIKCNPLEKVINNIFLHYDGVKRDHRFFAFSANINCSAECVL